jgi:hypothetical protein
MRKWKNRGESLVSPGDCAPPWPDEAGSRPGWRGPGRIRVDEPLHRRGHGRGCALCAAGRHGGVRDPLPRSRPAARRVPGVHRHPASPVVGVGLAGRGVRRPSRRRWCRGVPPDPAGRGEPDRGRGHLLLRDQAGPGSRVRRARAALRDCLRPAGQVRTAQAAARAAPPRQLHAAGGRSWARAGGQRVGHVAEPGYLTRPVGGGRVPAGGQPAAERDRWHPRVRRRGQHRSHRGPVPRGHRGRGQLCRDGWRPAARAGLGPGEDRHRPVRGPGAARCGRATHHDPPGRRTAAAAPGARHAVRAQAAAQGRFRPGDGGGGADPARTRAGRAGLGDPARRRARPVPAHPDRQGWAPVHPLQVPQHGG